MEHTMQNDSTLHERWNDALRERPNLRQRDAAELLGTTEGQLIASRCGTGTVRLTTAWSDMLPTLAPLGKVKTITRNAYAVHETVGIYDNVTFVHGDIGLVQSEGLDLRLLLQRWAMGFAVTEQSGETIRRSLQFFNRAGGAVHKIYLEPEADSLAFDRFAERFRSNDQSSAQSVEAAADSPASQSVAGEEGRLLDEWAKLRDTHDFQTLLARLRIDRRRAMDIAEGAFTRRLPSSGVRAALSAASDGNVDIMVFVGNPGAVQIYTGPIETVKPLGAWLNVLDPTFNLHLREDAIESVWTVTTPTDDGIVTSVEVYAADRSEVAVLYGRRKPGKPEAANWRALVEALPVDEVRP
jgi:putative hemin transport protein